MKSLLLWLVFITYLPLIASDPHSKHSHSAASSKTEKTYTCPMHPNIKQN